MNNEALHDETLYRIIDAFKARKRVVYCHDGDWHQVFELSDLLFMLGCPVTWYIDGAEVKNEGT